MGYEMLLFPAIGWVIHRQEQMLKKFSDIDKRLLHLEFLLPKRKADDNI